MSSAFVRELLPGDIQYVAAHLRAPDRQELAALGELDAPDALARAVMVSSHYWALAVRTEPLAVFGVSPRSLLGGSGAPWLLGTERVFSFPGTLVREGRRYVARMLEAYPHLQNYVDARNTRSVRWLARLGFEIHPAEPYGVAGEPFHKFEMRA